MSTKYEEVEEGEWFTFTRRRFKQSCCGCGLVHVWRYRITAEGQIEFQVVRNDRATAAIRRGLKRKHEKAQAAAAKAFWEAIKAAGDAEYE